MNKLFSECSSLVSLPDISKWNTNNVKYINNLFYGCSVIIPDISKWNLSNVENKVQQNFLSSLSSEKSSFITNISKSCINSYLSQTSEYRSYNKLNSLDENKNTSYNEYEYDEDNEYNNKKEYYDEFYN